VNNNINNNSVNNNNSNLSPAVAPPQPAVNMSRRSCYALEVTHEEIQARVDSLPMPSDEDIVPKESKFIKRKRNSFKSHRTLSDTEAKYYSCAAVRAQLGRLSKA
jgi:hypothetical protein